ncbi:MAG TPA: hypothetical protein VJR92_08695, partial [Gemmatimonadaceae bacterium]|nr:hypothetical protein [Gemmatimonadaceae bacterium]
MTMLRMRGAPWRSWRAARVSAMVAAAVCAACVTGYETPSDPDDPDGDPPPIPAGIAIEPGPSVGALSLRWPFVEEAQTYNVYWGTTADLNPSFKVSSVIPPFVHGSRTPGTVYYYAVTAVTANGVEGQPTTIISGMGRNTIALRVETPAVGALLGDDVEIVFSYTANEEPTNVTAEIAGVQTTMTYDPSISRFRGTLSLASVASPSSHRLTIHATGPSNEIAEAITSVRVDRPPVLQVFSPNEGITVTPSTQIFTTCADDAPNGCAALLVYPAGTPNAPIIVGTAG